MRSPQTAAVAKIFDLPQDLAERDGSSGPQASESPSANALDIAQYECDVLLQLRDLARRAELKFLAYLLEMAFEEAFSQANRLAEGEKAAQI